MIRVSVCGAVLALCAGSAMGASLGLSPGNPDVFAAFASITYDAGTHQLEAQGFTQNSTVDPTMGNRQWTLIATIFSDFTFASSATLIVRGDYQTPDQLLFSANTLTNFGYSNGVLEFVFSGTGSGGALNPAQSQVGVILSDSSMAFNSFSSSFANDFDARSDTFVIPAPGAAALAAGAGILGLRRRRR